MASQVAHIIYARKYLEKHPLPNGEEEKFILGCVFPDIRRIDPAVGRRETHLKFDPLDLDLGGLSSFQAGWKFHLYCDMKREEILNKYDFYGESKSQKFAGVDNKLLEDEVVYDECNNWEKLVNYFNSAPLLETDIGVSRETFSLWYAIIAKYIEKKPDSKAMRILLSKQPSLAEKANDIVKSVDELRKNNKAVEILRKIKDEIV